MPHPRTWLTAGFLAACGLTGSALAQASFQPLGFTPGATSSESLALSSDGSTVVGVAIGGGQFAFRWTAQTGMIQMNSGAATAASADGSVIYALGGCGSYRWTVSGGAIQLPGIGTGGSLIFSCSDDGASAGGRVCVSSGQPDQPPLLWRTTSGYQVFQGITGRINGLSADGSIAVGEMNQGAPDWQPFRWTQATGIVGLGLLNTKVQPGGAAYGVSDDGAVIVGVVQNQPFRWTQATGYQTLGVGAARAVSADGNVIVGTGPAGGAWVWTTQGGQQSLRDLLIAGGATGLQGWSLHAAVGVSADGAVVTGTGFDPQGRGQAFIARLNGTSCYANCDHSVASPSLNVDDFICFLARFAAGDAYANCDASTAPPVLNVDDFGCFLGRFAAGCD